jgi:hypothetical protein
MLFDVGLGLGAIGGVKGQTFQNSGLGGGQQQQQRLKGDAHILHQGEHAAVDLVGLDQ